MSTPGALGRTPSWSGQTRHHHWLGEGDAGHREAARHRREDPPPHRRGGTGRTDCSRGEDQQGDRGTEGDGPCARVPADGHPRCRCCRCRTDPRRRRRRRPVRRPEPLRVLDRHGTPRRLLRRAEPTPPLSGGEPPGQPHDPHRCGHAAAPGHRGPRLLPKQASSRQEAEGSASLPQATDLRAIYRQLVADAQRAEADPGGHCGASQESSAVDLPPHIDTSDQPLPGPAKPTLQPAQPAGKPSRSTTPAVTR